MSLYYVILNKWMLTHYPMKSDSGGAGAVSPQFTAARFRDALLQRLASYGSFESLEVLKSLQSDLPNFPWAYYLANADLRAREATWTPSSPRDLLQLAARSESRIVNSPDDLTQVIVEALGRISQKLHGETPAVAELWNYTVGKDRLYTPKDENDFSDWLKRRLEDEIVRKAIIIGREVEIRRRIASRPGERTDLYVTALNSTLNEKIVTVVEVKGCWHRELKTAMESQLVNRYLKENLYTNGIYLVGWFSCPAWHSSDYRSNDVPFSSLSDAEEYVETQARALSSGTVHITPFVLDVTIDSADPAVL